MSDEAASAEPIWEDPRKVLERHGFRPKKSFSQNFLVSRHVVERIAEAIAPASAERVVELGPGVGTLTAALLRAGARVIAVERDRDMLEVLERELGAHPRLQIVAGDAAELSLDVVNDAKGPIAVAGNLPYAITGAIFRRIVEQRAHVARAVFMVQKEVADRLRAKPDTSDYGALSVFVQAAFDTSLVCKVPRGSFHPPPKVESAVVRLVPRSVPRAEETPTFQLVVRSAFGTRRKTLRNALGRGLGDTTRAEAALGAADIDPRRRGETLSVEEFDRVARAVEALP